MLTASSYFFCFFHGLTRDLKIYLFSVIIKSLDFLFTFLFDDRKNLFIVAHNFTAFFTSSWAWAITRNTLIDDYRKNSIRKSVSLDDEDNYTEPSYEDEYKILKEDDEREVYRILSLLSESERELAGMIYFQNMKNNEIGEILGINAKAVSERRRRLLAKCRKLAGDFTLY